MITIKNYNISHYALKIKSNDLFRAHRVEDPIGDLQVIHKESKTKVSGQK